MSVADGLAPVPAVISLITSPEAVRSAPSSAASLSTNAALLTFSAAAILLTRCWAKAWSLGPYSRSSTCCGRPSTASATPRWTMASSSAVMPNWPTCWASASPRV